LRAGAIDFGTANPGTRPKCIPKFGLTELLLTQTHLDLPLLVLTQTHIRMALLHSILIHPHTHSHTTLSLSNGLCATANMGIPTHSGSQCKRSTVKRSPSRLTVFFPEIGFLLELVVQCPCAAEDLLQASPIWRCSARTAFLPVVMMD
jgi:hypothetical protein